MGKIVASENVSLDGVAQDPTGEEGLRHGGWFGQIADKDREAWAKMELDEALGAEALLLGRRSDEWFAARWLIGRTFQYRSGAAFRRNRPLAGGTIASARIVATARRAASAVPSAPQKQAS